MPAGMNLSEAVKALKSVKERPITDFEAEATRLALVKQAEKEVDKEEAARAAGKLIEPVVEIKKRGRPRTKDVQAEPIQAQSIENPLPRIYISFITELGTIKVPAIDAREGDYALFIRLPAGAMQFVPNIGTQFTVEYLSDRNDSKSVDVYFPGTSMEYPELGYTLLVMIKVPKE